MRLYYYYFIYYDSEYMKLNKFSLIILILPHIIYSEGIDQARLKAARYENEQLAESIEKKSAKLSELKNLNNKAEQLERLEAEVKNLEFAIANIQKNTHLADKEITQKKNHRITLEEQLQNIKNVLATERQVLNDALQNEKESTAKLTKI